MDIYGIGTAVRAVLNLYFISSRKSGRTTSMLQSLKSGDLVVCASMKEANFTEGEAKRMGANLRFIVIPPECPEQIFNRPPSKGRTIFSHEWVESFYLNAAQRAYDDIKRFQTESSGRGTAHLETRRQAEEIERYRPYISEEPKFRE